MHISLKCSYTFILVSNNTKVARPHPVACLNQQAVSNYNLIKKCIFKLSSPIKWWKKKHGWWYHSTLEMEGRVHCIVGYSIPCNNVLFNRAHLANIVGHLGNLCILHATHYILYMHIHTTHSTNRKSIVCYFKHTHWPNCGRWRENKNQADVNFPIVNVHEQETQ